MKLLLLATLFTTATPAYAFETITHILSEKTGAATVRLLRDTITRKKGVACTAKVEIAGLASAANLANPPTEAEIGMERYCGEIENLNIEKQLKQFADANDVLSATAKSELTEVIYVMPDNPVGQQCERQLIDYLEITMSNGGVLRLQDGFDFPGHPAPEACAGLR